MPANRLSLIIVTAMLGVVVTVLGCGSSSQQRDSSVDVSEEGDSSVDVLRDAAGDSSMQDAPSGDVGARDAESDVPTPAPYRVATVAGGDPGHADELATDARFNKPYGLAASDDGALYITDCLNHVVRRVEVGTGQVSTVAGQPGEQGVTDGTGSAARFECPWDAVVVDGALYVVDTQNSTIRRIDRATAEVDTVAGEAGQHDWADGVGSDARFAYPGGIAWDGTYLYVADTGNHVIRRLNPADWRVTTLAGAHGQSGSRNGVGSDARFFQPRGIVAHGSNLYVTDSANDLIRTVALSTGAVDTLAGAVGGGDPEARHADGVGAAARFFHPSGIAVDGAHLFVADSNNQVIRRISLQTGLVETVAGQPHVWGTADGVGHEARFQAPLGLGVLDGVVYVADTLNHRLRGLSAAD